MRTREEADRRRRARCRHFTGVQNITCEAGVTYPKAKEFPCFGEVPCPQYAIFTEEEVLERDREVERRMDCFRQGVSPCCNAPINENSVIREGRHKGHGPRYCSKCRALLFMV